jgi:hypothetical protein
VSTAEGHLAALTDIGLPGVRTSELTLDYIVWM